MNIQTKIQMYVKESLERLGYVCPQIGPLHCSTNQIVFKDVVKDMGLGLEYVELNNKVVMMVSKAVR